CSWASPNRANGTLCGPEPPPPPPPDLTFPYYPWPANFPAPPVPLSIVEAGLRPAGFVELLNTGSERLELAAYDLRIAPHVAGIPWPAAGEGDRVVLPDERLEPGARGAGKGPARATEALEADPDFQGVVTVFQAKDGALVDRADFSTWPDAAVL